MRDWLIFLGVVLGWAAVGRLVLEADVADPFALGIAWFVGLIWLIGWAVGSVKEANYLLKIMTGLLGVPMALGALWGFAESIFS